MQFDITSRIETWRTQLLDTTKRNRLISFKTGRSGGIPLVNPDPGELWHFLVSTSQPLTFPWKRDLIDLAEDYVEHSDSSDKGFLPLGSDEVPKSVGSQDILERCRNAQGLLPDH